MTAEDPDEAREVRAQHDAIRAELAQLLEVHTRALLEALTTCLERHSGTHEGLGAPRYGRWLAIAAVHDVLLDRLLAAIAVEGEGARGGCQEIVNHLHLVLAPPTHTH